MSLIQRVRVTIDAQWRETIVLPNGTTLPPRELRREKVPGLVRPDAPTTLPWPPDTASPPVAADPLEVQSLADRCQRLVKRRPVANATTNDFDVVEVGRHLFETLFGDGVWPQIVNATAGATMIELALEWTKDERDLHRLNWELMHGPAGFLAAGFNDAQNKLVRVAVSRVVNDAPPPARSASPLPRILFVVGCSLDDSRIRAGAELFGLLRQIKAKERGGTIVQQRYLPIRLIQKANPTRLKEALSEFQPEIVHFISHGTADSASLVLQPEKGQTDEQLVKPEQLLQLLTSESGSRPLVVVLSACFSGTVGGPWQGAPFAAELVAGGIPIVIGMAGEVADQACRLFTRMFGEALVYGKPLVAAVEAGRRAAFTLGNWPRQTVDWALPAFYRAPDVKSDFAVTAPDRSLDEQWLQDVFGTLLIEREGEPVMAARFEVLDQYYDSLLAGAPGCLVVLGGTGTGKSRLLRELAAQAAAQGHVPLLISADEPAAYAKFKDFDAVRLTWSSALERSCKALRLDYPNPSQLELLNAALPDAERAKLNAEVGRAFRQSPKTLKSLLLALQLDLRALLDQARAKYPARHPAGARAWLFLDHLHLYSPDLQPGFFDRDITAFTKFGLSNSSAEVLPVVLAFDPKQPSADGLKPVAEGKCKSWMNDLKLDPFPPNGSDVLCYSRVLLNPHNPTLYKSAQGEPISALPWIIESTASDELRDEWLAELRHKVKAQPCDFIETALYEWVHFARKGKFLRVADDEDKLKLFQP